MSAGWQRKRFWKEATVHPGEAGFAVHLDGRTLRTPGKALLAVPTEALARAIAAEWSAQEDEIRPQTMPFTRMANSAIEKVAPLRAEVALEIAGYGATDLLCYRAAETELARRQRAWDDLLDWAAERFGARLAVTEGVMPVAQDTVALALLAREVGARDAFGLTGLHDLVALSGSLILGLATAEGRLTPDEAWSLARLDESYQSELWGADAEAEAAAEHKRRAFGEAWEFLDLLRLPV